MTKSDNNIFQKCTENFQDKKLKLEEEGRKFYLENLDPQITIKKVKIDGCLITKGKRCDWLLLIIDVNLEIYVELKGKDIDKAYEQLEETINNQDLKNILDQQFTGKTRKKRGYIIHSRCPRSTDIQNLKKTFANKYKVILKVEKSGYTEKLSKL